MSSSKAGKSHFLEGACSEPEFPAMEGPQPLFYQCCGLSSPAPAFLVTPSCSHLGGMAPSPQVWGRTESSHYTHIYEAFVMSWGNVLNVMLSEKKKSGHKIVYLVGCQSRKTHKGFFFESIDEIHQIC